MSSATIGSSLASQAIFRFDAVFDDMLFRLSVDQYHRMVEAKILTESDSVELLEGCLVRKMAKKRAHSLTTQLTWQAIMRLAPAGWHVAIQEPATTEDSEPESDVALVRGSPLDYVDRHFRASDLALVVEVSQGTLHRDRTLKKRIYARAGVPVYWIINLADRAIEAHAAPSGPCDQPDYGQRMVYGEANEIPLIVAGEEVGRILVRELLPPLSTKL